MFIYNFNVVILYDYSPARPGINVLRYYTCYYLPEKDIEYLKNITDKTYINGDLVLNQQYEYESVGSDELKFGSHVFKKGNYTKETFCN